MFGKMTMTMVPCLSLALSLATGCGSKADSAVGDAPEVDPYAQLYDCAETAFVDMHPLAGPGFTVESGIIGEPQEEYIVSTTMLYWKEGKKKDFYQLGAELMAQLDASEGLVAYSLGTDENCRAARSIAVWRSEEDMYAFVMSGAHAKAKTMVDDLSNTGKALHYKAGPEELDRLTYDYTRSKLEDVEPSSVYE